MSNVSNLTSKILKEAEERKENILKAANEEKAKIIEKKNNKAKALEAEMIEKATKEAVISKERVISGAELQARNEKLKAKQSVIEDVFNSSVDSLCNLDNEAYKAFIKDSILTLEIDGDENLILNEVGIKIINEEFISTINKELISKGKIGKITLSKEVKNFKGGFILEKNGIEINNTFEALVTSLREELEFEVAKELFN